MRQSACLVFNPVTVNTLASSLTAGQWVGRQTQWWPRHKAMYFSWFGPELFCLLLGPPGFNCWFSFAPVFQWCCSTPQGSPGVGRNFSVESSSLFHHSIYLWFICFPWWSIDELRARLGSRKTGLSPAPPPPRPQYFNTGRSKAVLLFWFLTVTCSCCPYLYFGSAIILLTYFVNFR